MIEELRNYLFRAIEEVKDRQKGHERARFYPPEPADGEEEDAPFDEMAFRNKTLALSTELSRFKTLLSEGEDVCPSCYVLWNAKYQLLPADSEDTMVDRISCRVCKNFFRIPV